MACNVCGSDKAIVQQKVIFLSGLKELATKNKVLSFFCLKCGNLLYGYCRPVK